MSRITYLVGSALEPVGPGQKIIAHCVSDNGRSFGKGFALSLARKWPDSRTAYKTAYRDGSLRLGENVVTGGVLGPDRPEIISMVAQRGLGPTSLRLPELFGCLFDLAAWAIQLNASVHMPRIGCGLAGGKWEDVEPLIIETFHLPLASLAKVYVYDLPK